MHTTERFGAHAGKSGRKGGGPHDQGDLRHKRMSLDGFVTASGVRPEEPMGDGGQRLHEWASGNRMFEHLGSEHIRLETTEVLDTPAPTHLR